MGIKEVKKEIVDNARKEAKKILAEAEKEKAEIEKTVEETLKREKAENKREIEEALEQYRSAVLSEAESAVKKEKLVLEKELIHEVFSKAAQGLDRLSAKKREQHIRKLAKKVKELGYTKVYCAEKDQKYLKGHKAEKADILGGLILENDEGDKRVDLSYDVLLDEVKKEEMVDIAKKLFV